MGYTYDAGGNLLTRTDARNVVTTYAYDNLNRNTVTTYSDATPEVKRFYDGFQNGDQNQPFSKGALWRTETANTAQVTVSNFDNLSRPRTLTQAFFSNGGFNAYRYEVKREYDLTGAVTKQTYPSGHEVRYNFDAVKRLGDAPDANPQQPDLTKRAFNGNLGDGVTRSYADTPKYDERGLMSSERYGMVTPLYHRMAYNVRGQMTEMQLGSGATANTPDAFNRGRIQNYYAGTPAAPAASGSNNNGNLLAQDNSLPAYAGATGATTFRQTYGYDELNRLTGVSEFYNGGTQAQWQQNYHYDRWGNRTINQTSTTNGVPKPDFACDTATNRLLPGPNTAGVMSYDAAGNLTHDTFTGAGARVFDAENRMKQAWTGAANTGALQGQYAYDGDGRRISRTINNAETWQIYGFEGELVAEYAANSIKILPQKEYGYVGGKLLITASNGDDNRLRRFVENIYLRTWGVLPTEGRKQQGVNGLALALGVNGQGSANSMLAEAQGQVASAFDHPNYTDTTRTNEQYVADLYLAYLQRPPEPGAIAWFAGFLNNNQLTRYQLREEFANGPEFEGIVNALYGTQAGDYDRVDRVASQTYLATTGALPTTAQRDFERGRFDTAEAKGVNDVRELGKELGRYLLGATPHNYNGDNINFPYRSDLSTTEYVTRLYQTFLRRAPDSGLSGYVTQADQQGRSSVLEAFLSMSAYSERSGALYREIFWLISDHLGTPRMIAERTGKLEGIKRSDYLPFGESANSLGGRATSQGYAGESVRQGFTSKEEDSETGLDYFEARYYSPSQGRFISVDKGETTLFEPQSLNRYRYAGNNPLYYIDPDGNKDEPAKSKKINDALAADPTLLEVIKAANNFSQRAFEDGLNRGEFKGDLTSGSGNTLRGLSGEAIVIDALRNGDGAANVISQPLSQFFSRIGVNVALPNNLAPDIGLIFTSAYNFDMNIGGRRIAGNPYLGPGKLAIPGLSDVVLNAQGRIGNTFLPENTKFALIEVKAGFKSSTFQKGVNQVTASAEFLRKSNLPGVAVLTVDANVWNALSTTERTNYYNQVTAAGGYITVHNNLAVGAATRSRNIVKRAGK
jgi:RHS repeat-associated protein